MSQRKNLVQIAPGICANKSDPMLGYKKMKYGYIPESPLEEANILEDAADATSDPFTKSKLNQQIKDVYLRMLKYKQDLYIHQKLANVLTYPEAIGLANHYTHPNVKTIYYSKALEINPESKEATKWLKRKKSSARSMAWMIPMLALALLILLVLHHIFVINKTTTIIRNTVNHVTYIDRLNTFNIAGTLPVPSNEAPEQIANQVDNDAIPVGETYAIQNETGYVIGTASNQGNGQFQIELVNSKVATGQPLSAQQLNFIQTAYNFYVQTYGGPPSNVNQIKKFIPDPQVLTQIKFTPVDDPKLAIQQADGTTVPFVEPKILIDLKNKEMKLEYKNQILLQTPIGIGRTVEPTPVGQFQITGRLSEKKNSVYGPYVFPLNFSAFAIHGTNALDKIGKQESAGCVEIPNKMDAILFSLVPVGTPVYIEQSPQRSTLVNPKNFR